MSQQAIRLVSSWISDDQDIVRTLEQLGETIGDSSTANNNIPVADTSVPKSGRGRVLGRGQSFCGGCPDGAVELDQLIEAVIEVIEEGGRGHYELLPDICERLLDYFRRGSHQRRFVYVCLPSLLGQLLTKSQSGADQNSYECIGTLLLALYNLECVDGNNLVKRSFRFPILSKPSVYHEPPLVLGTTGSVSGSVYGSTAPLTEYALQRLETLGGSGELTLSSFGPYQPEDRLVAANRWSVVTVLLKIYNSLLSGMPRSSLVALCRNALKILNVSGGPNNRRNNKHNRNSISRTSQKSVTSTPGASSTPSKSDQPLDYAALITNVSSSLNSRIIPTPAFLVELLQSAYFCLFNDVTNEGLQVLNEIHQRASYQLYPDVLIMSNAIRNLLKLDTGTGKSVEDDELGLSLALSPTSTTSGSGAGPGSVSKAGITNASFRTKKLPDDIPIVSSNQSSQAGTAGVSGPGQPNGSSVPQLQSINEESEDNAAGPGQSGPADKDKNSKNSSKANIASSTTGSGNQSAASKITKKFEILKERKESSDSTLNKII